MNIKKLDFIDFEKEDFREMLFLMGISKASDAILASGEHIGFKIDGKMKVVSTSKVDSANFEKLFEDIFHPGMLNTIQSGEPYDGSYHLSNVKIDGKEIHKLGFRVHVSSKDSGQGFFVVIRSIPEKPPHYKKLGINEEIIDVQTNLRNGIGFICGETGSGKTTTIASIASEVLKKNQCHMICYESPIEYTYGSVEYKKGFVNQIEIPTDVKTYASAVRGSLRSAPNAIVVGETRDKETCEALLQASESGHNILTTLHLGRAHHLLERIASFYSEDHHNNIITKTIDQLNFIMIQILVDKIGGGIVAVRESLIFSSAHKRILKSIEPSSRNSKLEEFIKYDGIPFYKDSKRLFDRGVINMETHNHICNVIGENRYEIH